MYIYEVLDCNIFYDDGREFGILMGNPDTEQQMVRNIVQKLRPMHPRIVSLSFFNYGNNDVRPIMTLYNY